MASVRRRFGQGLLANGYSQVGQIVIIILQIPLLIRLWGKEDAAVWGQMMALVTFLNLCAVSLHVATGNEMMMSEGRGERDETIDHYRGGWRVVTTLSASVLALVALATPFIPWASFVQSTSVPQGTLSQMMLWLIGYVLLGQQAGVFDAGFRGANLYAKGLVIMTTGTLIEVAMAVGFAYFGGSLAHYAMGFFAGKALTVLIMAVMLRRNVPWLPMPWSGPVGAWPWPLIKPGAGHTAVPTGLAISLDGMRTSLTQSLGSPVGAMNYRTMQTLSRFVWQLVKVLGNIMWVELSRALGAGEIDQARYMHRRVAQLSLWISLTLSAGLFVAGDFLYTKWLDNEFPFLPSVFGLMLVSVVLSTFWSVSYIVPISVNKASSFGAAFIGAQLGAVVLAFFAARQVGLVGAAASMILADIFLGIFVMRQAFEILNETPRPFFKQVLVPPVDLVIQGFRRLLKRQAAS